MKEFYLVLAMGLIGTYRYSRHRVTLKKRYGLLITQQSEWTVGTTERVVLTGCREREGARAMRREIPRRNGVVAAALYCSSPDVRMFTFDHVLQGD